MEVRFSENRPWHFGYTPSSYYETLSDKQKAKVVLENLTLDNLDEIYNQTLQTPNIKKKTYEEEFGSLIDERILEPEILFLVANHCKPVGEFYFDKSVKSQLADFMDSVGVCYHFFDLLYSKKSLGVVFSHNQDLLEGQVRHQDLREGQVRQFESSNYSWPERRLFFGMMFGFPIGEVFSWTFEYENDTENFLDYDYLHFRSYPLGWSEEWQENVNVKGLKHMQKVYIRNLYGVEDWEQYLE